MFVKDRQTDRQRQNDNAVLLSQVSFLSLAFEFGYLRDLTS